MFYQTGNEFGKGKQYNSSGCKQGFLPGLVLIRKANKVLHV